MMGYEQTKPSAEQCRQQSTLQSMGCSPLGLYGCLESVFLCYYTVFDERVSYTYIYTCIYIYFVYLCTHICIISRNIAIPRKHQTSKLEV
jgi:hypothetical protein